MIQPPLHERLVARHPLPKDAARAAAARGLQEAAAEYACAPCRTLAVFGQNT